LLSRVPAQTNEEMANPRGQAVETFSNLLSEIRAYGQGVIIADQVPVRLAPDVMKNTNLKIAHRVVSADDREALAGAMAMDEKQSRALTALEIGEAAVFSGGDDAPLLVRIPLAKDALSPVPPNDDAVHEHMTRWREQHSFEEMFLPRAFCKETCATWEACAAARHLADDEYVQRTFSRLILSTIDEPTAISRLWVDLLSVLRARRPLTVPDPDLLFAFAGHGSDWLATRRGAQGSWSYTDTAEYRDRVRALVLEELHGGEHSVELGGALQATAHRLALRKYEPYEACYLVCKQDPPLCLYRPAVADLVASGRYRESWLDADEQDAKDEEHRRRTTWDVCQDAAYELVEFPDEDDPDDRKATVELAARRVCMCFEQQMLAQDTRKVPRTARRILARVIDEAAL